MPAMLTTAAHARPRPSADVAVPADVTDIMLWRLAFDVGVEHQRGPTGNCSNLRCAGSAGPCEPSVQARHAMRAARRPTTPLAAPAQPANIYLPSANRSNAAAVGRAAVARPNTGRFTSWFTRPAGTAVYQRRGSRLPNRIPGAALAAA